MNWTMSFSSSRPTKSRPQFSCHEICLFLNLLNWVWCSLKTNLPMFTYPPVSTLLLLSNSLALEYTPPIELSLSLSAIKHQIRCFMWAQFSQNFECYRPCTFHLVCPCNMCSKSYPPPTSITKPHFSFSTFLSFSILGSL